jgi:hypothetical protein
VPDIPRERERERERERDFINSENKLRFIITDIQRILLYGTFIIGKLFLN